MSSSLKKLSICGMILVICGFADVRSALVDFSDDRAQQVLKLAKSSDIKAYMTKADPCTDFYTFSCGNWREINRAHDGNINTDKFQYLRQGMERRLREFLLKPKLGNNRLEDKVKDFYGSCIKAKNDDEYYKKSLANIYKEFGEFSILKKEPTTDFKWWSTVARIQFRYGKSVILSLSIMDDVKNKTSTMLYIGPPEFVLTQTAVNMVQVIRTERIRQSLRHYLDMTSQQSSDLADDLMVFENNLKYSATDVHKGKSIQDLLTLYNSTDLYEKYHDLFDIKEYLEIALGTKQLPSQLYVYDEAYLKGLYNIINITDDQLVENYILWVYLKEYILDMAENDMQQECVDKTKKYFSKFIDHSIYQQYRSEEAQQELYELWDNIKAAFKSHLESLKYYWMTNVTRVRAIQKLNNMNLSLNSYDEENFGKQFDKLYIDPQNYVLNVQSIMEQAESSRPNKMNKKRDDDIQLLSFSPVYNILENQIKIPVAVMQPRFMWDPVYPKAIKYSTLGFLIAHEMLHGFDDEGRNYDAQGRAFNWWDLKSAEEFEARRKCFEQQYHSYIYEGEPLVNSTIQAENIADNGGLNIAYAAYKRWLDKSQLKPSEETLPRLPYTNHQLFFISFAQLWCEDIQSWYRAAFAQGDIHAPAPYRVIGSLSNSRDFASVYQCNKDEASMNPTKKCEIY